MIMEEKNILNKKFSLTEGLILEKKLDSIIRQIIRDVLEIIKMEQEGSFELPSELQNQEELYSTPDLETEFSVEVNLQFDENLSSFNMDANFYREEDTIEINIVLNPINYQQNLQKMIGSMNELLAHELTHIKQLERGDYLPDEEPEESFDYYTQKHELEAQYKGFKRRAKKEKRSIESVMDEWFSENQKIHNLSPLEIKKLKTAILNWEFY